MEVVDIFKTISSIVGGILSLGTLCGIVIKPLRNAIIRKIKQWSAKDEHDKEIQKQKQIIQQQGDAIKKEEEAIQDIKDALNNLVEIVSELSNRIFKNEADRLRSELFNCGNRCRRGIPLSGEEFRYVQGVFQKYSEELHENSIGEEEYNFIKDYFNSKINQDRLNKKYDN